jgi:hypothetical protein
LDSSICATGFNGSIYDTKNECSFNWTKSNQTLFKVHLVLLFNLVFGLRYRLLICRQTEIKPDEVSGTYGTIQAVDAGNCQNKGKTNIKCVNRALGHHEPEQPECTLA